MNEIRIPITGGQFLCFEYYTEKDKGCSYVRFVNEEGTEVAYWDYKEWQEDPKIVMGAIMACIQNGGE
tara:strand:- start:376 stop:579 length:204 start_codon:yes stop_codon:yes gene_type:complete